MPDSIEASENLRRLGRLFALQSVDRNLKTEDAAFRKQLEIDMADETISDGSSVSLEGDDSDPMRIIAANTGDIIIHRPDDEAQSASRNIDTNQGGIPRWLSAVVIAGAIGTSAMTGGLAAYMSSRSPDISEDTDTISDLLPGFGVPVPVE